MIFTNGPYSAFPEFEKITSEKVAHLTYSIFSEKENKIGSKGRLVFLFGVLNGSLVEINMLMY